MQASIQLANALSNQWVINVTDATSGQSVPITVYYDSSRLSAEWIVEKPEVNNQIADLANFQNVTFTDCVATLGATTGAINSFSFEELVIYSSSTPSIQLTNVSDLSPDGETFTVSYLASG